MKDQVAAGITASTPDGRTPAQQLFEIGDRGRELIGEPERIFLERARAGLAAVGIIFSSYADLDDDDRSPDEVFEQRIFPVLTPLAVDPGHPFPYISHLSLNLAVIVRDPITGDSGSPGEGAAAASEIHRVARR